METTGARISKLLKQRGMTQKDLAESVGSTEVSIGRYVNDKREPSASTITAIANELRVTSDYLLGISDNPKLNRKDEVDIANDLRSMRQKMDNGTLRMSLDGEEVSDEVKEFILEQMENALIVAKVKAKEKFTPKKYR